MFEALSVPAINRLLRTNPWALGKLRPHAQRTALLSCPPFELRATITDSGELSPAATDALPDVAILVTPGLLLRAATGDESAWRAAEISGDVELAATIDYLRRNLAWDYEEDLSRIFGDITAHRFAGAARDLDRWARHTAINVSLAVSEYATHEKAFLASPAALEALNRDVDVLRDDVARAEKRLQILQRRLHGA